MKSSVVVKPSASSWRLRRTPVAAQGGGPCAGVGAPLQRHVGHHRPEHRPFGGELFDPVDLGVGGRVGPAGLDEHHRFEVESARFEPGGGGREVRWQVAAP
ncbi:hypothetical protein [Micromonospora sp. LOL_021]|uniref:hypothetical protein n=1 Tax=Micromonospora sp. LOL_021 TaxID=3345417 RepID=UPI003A8A5469